jgi:uncharacterized protein
MPSPTLASATRFDITSKSTGRSYVISLHRPVASPLTGALENCPILFVLDGALTFGTAVESASLRTAAGQLEPAVIVGVAYDADLLTIVRMRTKDLTPPAPEDKYPEMAGMIGTEYGGADAFLEFLIDELAPEIRAREPEASKTRKALFGHSLGGLFVANALMRRPEAFETFAANSPALCGTIFRPWRSCAPFARKLRRSLPARECSSALVLWSRKCRPSRRQAWSWRPLKRAFGRRGWWMPRASSPMTFVMPSFPRSGSLSSTARSTAACSRPP